MWIFSWMCMVWEVLIWGLIDGLYMVEDKRFFLRFVFVRDKMGWIFVDIVNCKKKMKFFKKKK